MRCALLLAFTASLTLTPSLALASAAPWPVIREQDPMPTIAVEGDLQVTRGQITISCGLGEFVDVWATCTIEASLRVSTDAGARLTREPLPTAASSSEPDRMPHVTVIADRHPEDEVLLGGRPFVGTLALAPGMTRTLTVRATRELGARFQTNDYLLFSAPITRHLFLSESHAYRFEGERREAQLLRGDFTITGPVQLDARNTTGIEVKLGEHRVSGVHALPLGAEPIAFSLDLDRERDHDGPVASGGLAIHGAMRENLDVEDEGRALVALEYAFIIEEFVFVSAGLATDFQSAFQSLVVEVATPDLIFMIPSLSAGLGVVVRELGDRPTDAAFRARFSASWPVLGVNVDLDYWPDLGQWTSTLGLRIGL